MVLGCVSGWCDIGSVWVDHYIEIDTCIYIPGTDIGYITPVQYKYNLMQRTFLYTRGFGIAEECG